MRRFAWIPAVFGVALGSAATYTYIQASNRYDGLTSGSTPLATAQQYRSEGPTYQTASVILASAAGAALVTAGILFVAGGPSEARASLVPTAQGFAVVGVFQ